MVKQKTDERSYVVLGTPSQNNISGHCVNFMVNVLHFQSDSLIRYSPLLHFPLICLCPA